MDDIDYRNTIDSVYRNIAGISQLALADDNKDFKSAILADSIRHLYEESGRFLDLNVALLTDVDYRYLLTQLDAALELIIFRGRTTTKYQDTYRRLEESVVAARDETVARLSYVRGSTSI